MLPLKCDHLRAGNRPKGEPFKIDVRRLLQDTHVPLGGRAMSKPRTAPDGNSKARDNQHNELEDHTDTDEQDPPDNVWIAQLPVG